MTAPAQRSTCIGALPSNAGRRFPLDRTIFDMLKPMAYHLSPAVDSTMVGERPPPTWRNFSAALEGPTSRLANRNPGLGLLDKSLFWNILGPFFFLSTLTPTRRKGRATSNTR